MTAVARALAGTAQGLELGEGGRWVDGRLYLVDVLAGRLLVADAARGSVTETVLQVEGTLGAVAARRGHPGSWLAAMGPGIALVQSNGSVAWLYRPEENRNVSVRMNDGVADPRGRFWSGSMADDGTVGAGSLYRTAPDGSVIRVLDGLSIANGPAFNDDGSTMFLADSAIGVIDRFDVDPETGSLRRRARFVDIPRSEGSPDGMTVDAEGGLWVAIWGGGEVRRYDRDGVLDRVVTVPARQPTSVCLGGSDGCDLYITSAFVGLTRPRRADGRLFVTRAPYPGPSAVSAVLD